MKIYTWNVNSIRNKVENVQNLLEKYDIDILFLTETKIQEKHEKDIIFKNYKIIWNSNKNSYHHGVCFIYKENLNVEKMANTLPVSHLIVKGNLDRKGKNAKHFSNIDLKELQENVKKGHAAEGRILTIKYENIILVGTYVPNSGCDRQNPLKRLAYRILCWDKDLYTYLQNLEKEYSNVIWLGDLNVAVLDNDIYNPKVNLAGTTAEERSNMKKFFEGGWVDTWDRLNLNIIRVEDRCTYGVEGFCKLRLDYIICSPGLRQNLVSSESHQQFSGSDHCPVGTIFNL